MILRRRAERAYSMTVVLIFNEICLSSKHKYENCATVQYGLKCTEGGIWLQINEMLHEQCRFFILSFFDKNITNVVIIQKKTGENEKNDLPELKMEPIYLQDSNVLLSKISETSNGYQFLCKYQSPCRSQQCSRIIQCVSTSLQRHVLLIIYPPGTRVYDIGSRCRHTFSTTLLSFEFSQTIL